MTFLHAVRIKLPSLLLCLILGFLASFFVYQVGHDTAHAEGIATIDAGTLDAAPAIATPAAPMLDAGVIAAPAAGSGSAAPVVSIPDPTTQPVETATTVVKFWKQGLWFAAIVLGSFFALTWASIKIKWLQVGRRAAFVAAALGGLTMMVDAIRRGETPNYSMLMTGGMTAIGLLVSPKKPADNAAKRSDEALGAAVKQSL